MQKGIQVIKTIPISSWNLVSTNIPANDYPAYSTATTYVDGDRVVISDEVWESIANSNTNHTPGESDDWWSKVGPINRLKAFDLSNTTKTMLGVDGWYQIKPYYPITDIAFIGLSNTTSIRVRVYESSTVVYDVTKTTSNMFTESTWWAWTFEPRLGISDVIFSDLPMGLDTKIRVDFAGNALASVGVITYGSRRSIGVGLKYGASLSIQDYSRKERNDYGDTLLVQRAFAKEASFNVDVPNEDIDNIYTLLSSLRATPCLWIGNESLRSTVVWGFYRNFNINIAYPTFSEVSIELEGLT